MRRRLTLALALLLVFALTVPASAATWRNIGIARAIGYEPTSEGAFPALDGTVRNVKKIQVGLWQNSGEAREFDMNYYIICSRSNSNRKVKEKIDVPVTVPNRQWKWKTIWNKSNAFTSCQVYASAWGGPYFKKLYLRTRVQ